MSAGGDEGVEELVVAVVADPGVPLTEVERVVEQLQVVGADVQDDGQGAAGVDAAGGGVDGEFADGDLDAADALVADAEDAFGVGGDQQVDVVGAETGVPEGGFDLVGVVDGQVHAAGAAEFLAEPLDGLPDGGGVDHREHLGQVTGQQLVVQDLVAVPQVGQQHPLAQVAALGLVLGVDPAQLALQGGHPGGQQPGEAQRFPLRQGERGAAVDAAGAEDCGAADVDLGGDPVRGLDQFVGVVVIDFPCWLVAARVSMAPLSQDRRGAALSGDGKLGSGVGGHPGFRS